MNFLIFSLLSYFSISIIFVTFMNCITYLSFSKWFHSSLYYISIYVHNMTVCPLSGKSESQWSSKWLGKVSGFESGHCIILTKHTVKNYCYMSHEIYKLFLTVIGNCNRFVLLKIVTMILRLMFCTYNLLKDMIILVLTFSKKVPW